MLSLLPKRTPFVNAKFETPIVVATIGVLIGTLFGERLLFGLPPRRFQRVVGVLIGVLGIWLIMK